MKTLNERREKFILAALTGLSAKLIMPNDEIADSVIKLADTVLAKLDAEELS